MDRMKLSLTIREEYKLKVFENRALRKIFRSKKDEVIEEGGDYNEKLHNLYNSPIIPRI